MHPIDRHRPTEPEPEPNRAAGEGDHDETGIRSLLSGLGAPGVPSDLTHRLRSSLSAGEPPTPDQRRLPPIDAAPPPHRRLRTRALLGFTGCTLVAGLVGAIGLTLIRLPDAPVADVLATTTLTRAGISVTYSGTHYRAETLADQAARLLSGSTGNSTSGGAAVTAASVGHGISGSALGGSEQGQDPALEGKVLACLRHLRMPAREVVVVDLAQLDGVRAAVVVTHNGSTESVQYTARAIDPACPVLGDEVLAGPTLLRAEP